MSTGPVRSCVGCGRRAPAAELERFVRIGGEGEGSLVHGPTLPGRGAWLCAATLDDCAALALRRRAFDRALRGAIDPRSIEEAVAAAAMSVRAPGRNARG